MHGPELHYPSVGAAEACHSTGTGTAFYDC